MRYFEVGHMYPIGVFEADPLVDSLIKFATNFCSAVGGGFFWLDGECNITGMGFFNYPAAMYCDYLERINKSDPLHVGRLVSSARGAVMLDEAAEGLEMEKVSRYRSFLGEYGIGDEVNFLFRHEGRPVAGMGLVRQKGAAPFERERYDWGLMHGLFEQSLMQHPHVRSMAVERLLIEQFCLTKRERKVLRLLARGLSNSEIGAAMGVSLSTTKTHIVNILDKLDVSSRTAAAAVLFQIELV